MTEREQIRTEMKQRRAALSDAQVLAKSAQITERLLGLRSFTDQEYFFCYVSCKHEVSTKELLLSLLPEHKVYVPKVTGKRQMTFYRLKSMSELAHGAYGIMEPAFGALERPISDSEIDAIAHRAVVILPGLAFDREGNRLGYGGGYYDVFLDRHQDIGTIALGYAFQLQAGRLETLPTDRKVKWLVTEKAVYLCTQL